MPSLDDDARMLSELMEREIAAYGALIRALKEEAECLRDGRTDDLVKVVSRIEIQTEALCELRPLIQASAGRLQGVLEKDGQERSLSQLISLLPLVFRGKMRSCRQTVIQLQERAAQLNERNKEFIGEHLSFFRQLTSLLIHPEPDHPYYPRTGRPASAVPSYALNREV